VPGRLCVSLKPAGDEMSLLGCSRGGGRDGKLGGQAGRCGQRGGRWIEEEEPGIRQVGDRVQGHDMAWEQERAEQAPGLMLDFQSGSWALGASTRPHLQVGHSLDLSQPPAALPPRLDVLSRAGGGGWFWG
jgi:hypothetical protein